MRKINVQKGQLLIEAILALAIVVIIVTGIVIALVYSINNSTLSKDQNIATGYAQEGLDIIRNMKDSDYNTFSGLNGTYCLPEGITAIDPSADPSEEVTDCALIANRFKRQIYINPNGEDTRPDPTTQVCNAGRFFVASIILWSEKRCENQDTCGKVELNSCFKDLNQVDAL